MRFLFAFFAVACYGYPVHAEGDLSKSCFNMAVIHTVKEVAPAAKVPAKAPVATNASTPAIIGYRKASGHSHSCSTCGVVWDHKSNKTHECMFCKGHPEISPSGGYYADSPTKLIPIYSTATPAPRPAVQAAPRQVTVGVQLYRYGASSGCANGNCNISTGR